MSQQLVPKANLLEYSPGAGKVEDLSSHYSYTSVIRSIQLQQTKKKTSPKVNRVKPPISPN